MSIDETIKSYNQNAVDFSQKYESLSFEQVHSGIMDLMPDTPSIVLDVGAGSGRDAAWFASKGCEVIAVEPATAMLEQAKQLHPEARIRWIEDKLPGLEATMRLGISFDYILVSAVWMHIPSEHRERAFRKLVCLLKAGGSLIISLRHGPLSEGRNVYPVSVAEIEKLALQHGIAVKRVCRGDDQLARNDVSWETVFLTLPDDGTGALPLLRHTILNDTKSSTYKLGLLRVLVRIADSAVGVARINEDTVSIPFGLVALYWLRMYKPLVEKNISQKPASKDQKGLGFVKEAFININELSPQELRVGASFIGTNAKWVRDAIIDSRNTINEMPATFIKYPNSSEQIFKRHLSKKQINRPDKIVLNNDFLWSLGEFEIPREIWFAMTRFASWIEPVLIHEWVRLMQQYEASHGRRTSFDTLMNAVIWLEPERDTNLVRKIAQTLLVKDLPVYCVWSGKKLTQQSVDIDHCFPFAAWPCGDLWNLLPSQRQINQVQKSDRLVTASTLNRAKERVLAWWQTSYLVDENDYLNTRFISEAQTTLPISVPVNASNIEDVFDALVLKRMALKQDLQLDDWDYK